jgi:hypothetical protein
VTSFFDPPPSPVSELLAWTWSELAIAHVLDSLPSMSRTYAESLGTSDEKLEKRRRQLFGREPGRLRLSSFEPDTQALQCRRAEVWSAVTTIDFWPCEPTPELVRAEKRRESVIITQDHQNK